MECTIVIKRTQLNGQQVRPHFNLSNISKILFFSLEYRIGICCVLLSEVEGN